MFLKPVRKFLSVLSFLALSACIAPPQDFAVDSAHWQAANVEFVGSQTPNAGTHAVLVGVLDGGFDYNSPRLLKHIHVFETPASSGRSYGVGYDVLGKDFFPNFKVLGAEITEDLSETMGLKDHGTHVAQLVTLNDASIGLIPVRVLPVSLGEGQMPSMSEDPLGFVGNPELLKAVAIESIRAIEKGIDFAVSHGASIVNMSLGLGLDELPESKKQEVIAVVNESILARMTTDWRDCLMVVAAGNENTVLERLSQSIPATLETPDLLAVGALKDQNTVAYYSNRGRFVDLYVRGSDIKSALPGGVMGKISGTSMASPLVAHAAAQVKAIDPSLTPRELRALLLNTADIKALETEPNEDVPVTPPVAVVRVLNMKQARNRARWLKAHPGARAQWLTPPFAHGQAE